MATNKQFDEALASLARSEGKSKSSIVRQLVLERFRNKRRGFRFGSLAGAVSGVTSDEIQQGLKDLDRDDDLG